MNGVVIYGSKTVWAPIPATGDWDWVILRSILVAFHEGAGTIDIPFKFDNTKM